MTGESLFAGDQLVGEVVDVRYASEDSGFGVIGLDTDGGEYERCTGPLADLVPGQQVRLVGRIVDHKKYGRTFEAVLYEQVAPSTVAGLKTFLGSTRFKDVSKKDVQRVLTVFGSGAGDVIERQPERLVQEAGLEPDAADELHVAWELGRSLGRLARLFEPAGLPMDVARAAHARFGAAAVEVLKDDPYQLLDVDRARFAHADALGRHLGIEPGDPRRLAAGARAAVRDARNRDGHQVLPAAMAVQATAALLRCDVIAARAGVDAAVGAGALAIDDVALEPGGPAVEVVATPGGLRAERDLASGIGRLVRGPSRLEALAANLPMDGELTAGQQAAVHAAFAHPVSVLTGGPGTGKTRTIDEIVKVAATLQLEIALCAPTGRAAKRIEEVVGHAAVTIHRMLEARPVDGQGFVFRFGDDERLPYDLIVADEVSMCDTSLARRLVAAVETGSHLVLVGDPDQLPSVGPGDVLRDLIRSGSVPTTELVEVHRQAAASRIVGLAREVNAGRVGSLPGIDGDVFMAEDTDPQRIVARVVAAVTERAPEYFGVTPDDVQVVAPMYKGPVGVDTLNAAIKAAINPDVGQVGLLGFQEGDRVMQTRNDPDLDVSNGDIGTVVDVTGGKSPKLRVGFPRGEVTYDREAARELTHAWTVTVHKSQGGEWPVVVLVCDRRHQNMLWRNLLYTAITRAQKALIIVGQRAALQRGADHDRPSNRHTGLVGRLAAQDLDAVAP